MIIPVSKRVRPAILSGAAYICRYCALISINKPQSEAVRHLQASRWGRFTLHDRAVGRIPRQLRNARGGKDAPA